MTECNQQSFQFEEHFSRQVTGHFNGGQHTSDAGGLLLREADRRLNLLSRFASCFVDGRDGERIDHTVAQMTAQRVYGIALGYEDLNDMSNCGMIRCCRCWPGGKIHKRRWPARAR